MEHKIYVGNLNYDTSENDLRGFFENCGSITDVSILQDKITGKARGFAFVTFEDTAGMNKAIGLSGEEMMGRTLKISQAEQKKRRPEGRSNSRYSDDRDFN